MKPDLGNPHAKAWPGSSLPFQAHGFGQIAPNGNVLGPVARAFSPTTEQEHNIFWYYFHYYMTFPEQITKFPERKEFL